MMINLQMSEFCQGGGELVSYNKSESFWNANYTCTHPDPGYHPSNAWSTNRDYPYYAQYFNPK
jgi:hypothetical protein